VIATYLLAIAVFTTWPRRLRNRRWWRVAHLGSVVGLALGLVHAYQTGSDATSNVARAGLVVLAAVSTYALGLRLFGQLEKSRNARQP
jgi:drug/metabolite transporter (DMT)-like permease